jgi:hypothetical protein
MTPRMKRPPARKRQCAVYLQCPSGGAPWANTLPDSLRISCVGGDIYDGRRHKWKCTQQAGWLWEGQYCQVIPGPKKRRNRLVCNLQAEHVSWHQSNISESTELCRPSEQLFLACLLLRLSTFIGLVTIERVVNRDTISLRSALAKMQKYGRCGKAATFRHSIATSTTPPPLPKHTHTKVPKPKGEKGHRNEPKRAVSLNSAIHNRQVHFATENK